MNGAFPVIAGLVLAVLALVICTVKLKLHPFFALIATSFVFAIVSGMGMEPMLKAFADGMGGTVADIGLVIALGTVTGSLLEKSGAAETMAKTILKITGKKHAALGLAITGYFVSIPVFCDSAFVLLSPIAKRLSRDTKISMTTMAISLCMGLHATHMFVPPTPGPLAVAGILSADLGQVILFGALVSIPVTLVAYLASLYAGKKVLLSAHQCGRYAGKSEPAQCHDVLPADSGPHCPDAAENGGKHGKTGRNGCHDSEHCGNPGCGSFDRATDCCGGVPQYFPGR